MKQCRSGAGYEWMVAAVMGASQISAVPLGDLGWGVTGPEPGTQETNQAYLLFSTEGLEASGRFNLFVPNGQTESPQAEQFVLVYFSGTQWMYYQNENDFPFTPNSSDMLIAQVDYPSGTGQPTLTSLEGENSDFEGIQYGYESGDLSIIIWQWNGSSNVGEFTVTGTELIPHFNVIEPDWWSLQGVTNENEKNNNALANIGQAKNMVRGALSGLEAAGRVDLKDSIEPQVLTLIPSGETFDAPANPSNTWYAEQHRLLVTGQLKALAKPFYDEFQGTTALQTWIADEMALYGTATAGIYPWTDQTDDDEHLAPATIAQLKACFAFGFEGIPAVNADVDGDGYPDDWELLHFGDLTTLELADAADDLDGDGIQNSFEAQLRTDPNSDQTLLSSEREEYNYFITGRLNTVSGSKSFSYSFDNEGNIQTAN